MTTVIETNAPHVAEMLREAHESLLKARKALAEADEAVTTAIKAVEKVYPR